MTDFERFLANIGDVDSAHTVSEVEAPTHFVNFKAGNCFTADYTDYHDVRDWADYLQKVHDTKVGLTRILVLPMIEPFMYVVCLPMIALAISAFGPLVKEQAPRRFENLKEATVNTLYYDVQNAAIIVGGGAFATHTGQADAMLDASNRLDNCFEFRERWLNFLAALLKQIGPNTLFVLPIVTTQAAHTVWPVFDVLAHPNLVGLVLAPKAVLP